MKIKIVDTNLDVRPNLSPYFIQSIYDYYIGRRKGELLCWLYFDDNNYFLIGLEDPEDEYIECTPIIKIHRHPETNPCYFENDRGPEDLLKYPWIIMSMGCDDGSKGWRFETEKQLDEWYELLRMEVIDLKVQECLSDSYEFWDYFSENQVWAN